MRKYLFISSILMLTIFMMLSGCDRRVVSGTDDEQQGTQNAYSINIYPQEPLLFVDTTSAVGALDTLLVQVLDAQSTAIEGAEVEVTLIPGSQGALYPANTDTVTNHQGQMSFVYQTVDGMDLATNPIVQIMARSGSAMDTTQIELRIQEANAITIIQPLGEFLYTDPSNTEETEVRALLTIEGHAQAGLTVNFMTNPIGVITGSAVTDEQGVATAWWIETSLTGMTTITASYGSLQDSRQYEVLMGVGDASNVVLETEYTELPQGEITSSMITATVYDPLNNPVEEGTNVQFSTTLGSIPFNSTTDIDGNCSVIFSMGSSSGLAEITATVSAGGVDITATTYIMLNAGIPANIALRADNPVIEIMGSGSMSQTAVHAEVLDPTGYAVAEEVEVAFTIVSAPDSVSMSVAGDETRYWYRAISQTSDTLHAMTTNGQATMSVNSWKHPGVVMVQAYVVEYPDILSQRALITIVSGPPTYGYVDRNAVGIQLGAGMWQIEWAAHFWDQFSNQVRDSTAVYFHAWPEFVCDINGDAFTGNENRGGETHPGIAFTDMVYSSGTIGDTLFLVEACCAGLVPEDPEDPESPFVPGDLCVAFDAPFFILPFQPGDLGQNLTVQGETDALTFDNPNIPGAEEFQDVLIQARIVDGYGTPVHNQIIQFSASSPNNTEWDPPMGNNIGISDDQGMVQKTLRVYQTICENMWTWCDPEDQNYYQFAPFTLNVWAVQLPDFIQSNQWTIQCTTPCPAALGE
jgi:hypothetical protein